MPSLTANKTAKLMDAGGHRRTILESEGALLNCSEPRWMSVDGRLAVFKTV